MTASEQAEEKPTSTLFVRSLPFSTTDEQLEDVFSQIGPLQQCFVVKDEDHHRQGAAAAVKAKGAAAAGGKCKGYGFVRFATWKDAKKAKESIDAVGGRKIQIHYSKPRVAFKDRKGMPSKKAEGERQRMRSLLTGGEQRRGGLDDGGGGDAEGVSSSTKPSQLPFHFLVGNLPDLPSGLEPVAELTNFFAEIPGFDRVSATDGQGGVGGGGGAFPAIKISFSTKHLAMIAKKTLLKRKKFRGTKLNLLSEKQESSLFANARKNRLIVRNLPFKVDEDGLKKAFATYGQVQEVTIPKRADDPKKMLGFGFVQLADGEQAKAALEGMNLSDLMGRKIAVDWAVPKKQFMVKAVPAAKPASERDSAVEMDDDADDDGDDGDRGGIKIEGDDSGSEEMKEDDDDDDDDDDSNADDDENDFDASDNKDVAPAAFKVEDFDREEWERKKKVESGRDVEEGRTIFLRNVDFAVDENELTEFAKRFGQVILSRVVYDHSTGHSKGCAFVQFQTKDGAQKCLEAAAESGGLRLGAQTMVVNLALPKKEAKKMTNEAQKMEGKQPKDKRNLYLAREGFIRPGSDAAEGVSAADMNRRMKLVSLKKQKLKNTNFFISDTRLSVHNLPATCDEKKLKKLFRDAVVQNGVKGPKITECRIMRDGGRVSAAKGQGKSRGFGFVAFASHDQALLALRHVNNNPDIVGDKRRLIVEFSVESSKALQIKEKRREKMKGVREAKRGDKDGGDKASVDLGGGSAPGASTTTAASSNNTHGGFQAEKGKPIQGLPKRLGAKMRHKDRKGKGEKIEGKKKKNKKKTGAPEPKKTTAHSEKSATIAGDKKKRTGKFKKGRRGDDKEERTFQTLVKKYKGGNKQNIQRTGKKWDT